MQRSIVDCRDVTLGGSVRLITEYRNCKAAGENEKAAFAIGRALHYLSDTYAEGHSARDPSGLITRFQDYSKQSPALHGGADKLAPDSAAFGSVVQQATLLFKTANDTTLTDQALRAYLQQTFFQINNDTGTGDTEGRFGPRPY